MTPWTGSWRPEHMVASSPTSATHPPSGNRDEIHAPEAVLAGFAHALRSAGLPVTTDRTHTFIEAVSALDYGSRSDVYWAGRAVFCACSEDLGRFDRVFANWFTNEASQLETTSTPPSKRGYQAGLQPGEDRGEEAEPIAALASGDEQLRHRDVAALNSVERAMLNREFSSLRVRLPLRRTLRTERFRRGRIDRVRTLRDQLRRAGEPGPLRYSRRGWKQRPIVFLIDVSGSMKHYADSLLRLAHRVARSGNVEVFTLGTRLTRVTEAVKLRDPDSALLRAGETIPDWSGGTRLGEVLGAFVDRWGRRGLARGATVVIASDGWERGDTHALATQMRHLRGLAHRIVWSNPHSGKPGYEPVQSGIAAALPYVDVLVAGHSLAAFDEVLRMIGANRL